MVIERKTFPPLTPLIEEVQESMQCIDLKCFVPAKDYAQSIRFYKELGFKENWSAGYVTEFQVGSFRFLLQDFYNEEHTKNFILHLLVDSAQSWYDEISSSIDFNQYAGAGIESPKKQPWGIVTAYLKDPSGVLWHIAEQSDQA